MISDCRIIAGPEIDFGTFLSFCHQILGYSPASSADASGKSHSDVTRFLSCLRSVRESRAPHGWDSIDLCHLSITLLVIAPDAEMHDILSLCSCMPFVIHETHRRGVLLAVLSGTLAQWRLAVIDGTQSPQCRAFFNRVYARFEEYGLADLWSTHDRREAATGFYLEHKS